MNKCFGFSVWILTVFGSMFLAMSTLDIPLVSLSATGLFAVTIFRGAP